MGKISYAVMVAFIVIFLAGTALAENKLEITDLVAKVNGEKESADESGGTIDVLPDSKLSMKIEITNTYDDDIEGEDIEIEDVEVEVIIEDIDDGDDMDETSDDADINPGRDKTFNVDFEIPLKIDHDETYTMIIKVTGEDDEGNDHLVELELDVEVDKENHELRFLRKELIPSTVSCSRSANLRVDLINTGESDEDVQFMVTNTALNYNIDKEFELVENIDDSDNEYSFEDTLNLAGVNPGSYPLKIIAKYRDGREILEDTLDLKVEECEETKPAPEPEEPKTTTPKTTTPKTTTPKTTTTTTTNQPTVQYVPSSQPQNSIQVVSQPVPDTSSRAAVATPKTSYSQDSWWDENKWVVIILGANVLLLIVGIALVLTLIGRKNN